MREVRGDLWDLARVADAVVITTNGNVKKNGEAVMGKGCAAEAARRFPWLPKRLGERITAGGNVPYVFYGATRWRVERLPIITFPVKHNWWDKADLRLIVKSARAVQKITVEEDFQRVVMPRPGCGSGGLDWETVRSWLDLDDHFTVVTW